MIQFKYLIDMLTVATPSSGFAVGYDLDGILKQKDSLGAITLVGGGPSGPSFSGVLSTNNITGPNDIIISENRSIKSATGGGQINLDYAGTPGDVFISNDNGAYTKSQLYLSNGYVELSNYDTGGITSLFADKLMMVSGAALTPINSTFVWLEDANSSGLVIIKSSGVGGTMELRSNTFINLQGGGVDDYSKGFLNIDQDHVSIGFNNSFPNNKSIYVDQDVINLVFDNESHIYISSGTFSIGYDGLGVSKIVIDKSFGVTTFTSGDGAGIKYASDYSIGFTDRSLVDKAYVDSGTPSLSSVLSVDNDTNDIYIVAPDNTSKFGILSSGQFDWSADNGGYTQSWIYADTSSISIGFDTANSIIGPLSIYTYHPLTVDIQGDTNAVLRNANGGFVASDLPIAFVRYIQVSSASNVLKHTTQTTLSSPIYEWTSDDGGYMQGWYYGDTTTAWMGFGAESEVKLTVTEANMNFSSGGQSGILEASSVRTRIYHTSSIRLDAPTLEILSPTVSIAGTLSVTNDIITSTLYRVGATAGFTGTFSADGQIVTIIGGIITSVV